VLQLSERWATARGGGRAPLNIRDQPRAPQFVQDVHNQAIIYNEFIMTQMSYKHKTYRLKNHTDIEPIQNRKHTDKHHTGIKLYRHNNHTDTKTHTHIQHKRCTTKQIQTYNSYKHINHTNVNIDRYNNHTDINVIQTYRHKHHTDIN